ncbi:hypothetical protein [Pedobacter miscanthi]|uniref:Uncharacterized protein n=1 Tax=Pedobacter miscanthi TaxID=2259170 RepID=A0A366KYK7_9SPHI|nr:hypothetical protein [Pedobacter miscanthi]RBQ06721.1 hypothetical protein DRW42_13130 [Pedobacter miscanthi]
MKERIFLSAEKSQLIARRDEIKELLQDVESLAVKSNVSIELPQVGVTASEEEIVSKEPVSLLQRLKKIATVLRENLEVRIEEFGLKFSVGEAEQCEIYPLAESWEPHLLYEYLGDDVRILEFVQKAKGNFLAEAALLLKKKLEKLESRIRHVIRAYYNLMVDKRASFRSIVRLMFKDMDDEDRTVNNQNQFNCLSYLHFNILYGIRTYQKTAGSFNRTAIAG